MAKEFYARIRPGNGVQRYALRNKLFYAKKGWYKVSESFARELAKQPLNILNPSAGPTVFEVKTRAEAKRIEEHEMAKVDPAGTVDEPVTVHDDSDDEPKREEGFGDMTSEDIKSLPDAEPESPAEDEDVPGLTEAAFDESDASEGASEPASQPAPKPRKKVAKKRARKKVARKS